MKFLEVEAASIPKVTSAETSSELTETKEDGDENEGGTSEKKKRIGFRDRKVSCWYHTVKPS